MSELAWIDTRVLGWRDMIRTGVDDRQLRNAIDRGTLKIGEKHRLGHLTFSFRERFTVSLVETLTRLWMPVGTAAIFAKQAEPHLEHFLDIVRSSLTPTLDDLGDPLDFRLIISPMEGGAGLFYRLNGKMWSPDPSKDANDLPPFYDLAITATAVHVSITDAIRSQLHFVLEHVAEDGAEVLPNGTPASLAPETGSGGKNHD
ncbi:hypothetical protein E5673_08565 [Sphingomonas sp. PAMC26645]|uniref:hypothetical protein n=1 Tax=Sphingomonas sp. PAMC26645 TaxID=2565555 RepID=UPI00109DEDA3|nr:hypothetical protein [Sphingomonas sp. PAMC26645]QCB42277.1 hypothetical protein E5673_08565 [Sphingomonas sp. PAMC26645]